MNVKGTINKRIISGKTYYYHQYLENGKQVSKLLNEYEAYDLAFKLYFNGDDIDNFLSHSFKLDVNYGQELFLLTKNIETLKKRYHFADLYDYLNNEIYGKVLILYGLRRTGKTTLMHQAINSFNIKDFSKVAYIKCRKNNNIYELFDDLKYLTSNGFKYIFIDEITLLEDFTSLASTLSDIYGMMAKIVLSGTDSLGFLIASRHELYDRCKLIHTTYISFKEFSDVLGKKSIDEYIEFGGTMSPEGVDYNKTVKIDKEAINEYVDSAIIHNIIHSLECYKDGRYFFHLYDLYEKGELENVINRIIEDQNHRFAVKVIERNFKSRDYGSLKQLLHSPSYIEKYGNILDDVDEEKLTNDLKERLNIINKERLSHKIDEDVLKEVNEYLVRLDVLSEINEVVYPGFMNENKYVFSQPGLRYSQAKTLIELLLKDESLKKYGPDVLNFLKEKCLSDVKGRMLEEIVLLETSLEAKNTFKMSFGALGEFDMANYYSTLKKSNIFEIKYSSFIAKEQYKFLIDESMVKTFEGRYYPVDKRIVLYRGKSFKLGEISYVNVNQYLTLPKNLEDVYFSFLSKNLLDKLFSFINKEDLTPVFDRSQYDFIDEKMNFGLKTKVLYSNATFSIEQALVSETRLMVLEEKKITNSSLFIFVFKTEYEMDVDNFELYVKELIKKYPKNKRSFLKVYFALLGKLYEINEDDEIKIYDYEINKVEKERALLEAQNILNF